LNGIQQITRKANPKGIALETTSYTNKSPTKQRYEFLASPKFAIDEEYVCLI
jgi:hypothetical protein